MVANTININIFVLILSIFVIVGCFILRKIMIATNKNIKPKLIKTAPANLEYSNNTKNEYNNITGMRNVIIALGK